MPAFHNLHVSLSPWHLKVDVCCARGGKILCLAMLCIIAFFERIVSLKILCGHVLDSFGICGGYVLDISLFFMVSDGICGHVLTR